MLQLISKASSDLIQIAFPPYIQSTMYKELKNNKKMTAQFKHEQRTQKGYLLKKSK